MTAPEPSPAEQAVIDRFGMFAAEIAAERRCPRCRMDYPDHMPGEDECRPCARPHADAAEEPEEVVVERMAQAMWATSHGLPWSHAEFRAEADDYRAMATAALTALRGDRAPLAGQHPTDEEADRG